MPEGNYQNYGVDERLLEQRSEERVREEEQKRKEELNMGRARMVNRLFGGNEDKGATGKAGSALKSGAEMGKTVGKKWLWGFVVSSGTFLLEAAMAIVLFIVANFWLIATVAVIVTIMGWFAGFFESGTTPVPAG